VAIVVLLEARPDSVSALEEELRANQSKSIHEPGCLKWEWSRKVSTPNMFAIYEIYRDEEAVAAHMASAHLKRWLERTPALLLSKSTDRYNIEGADPQRK